MLRSQYLASARKAKYASKVFDLTSETSERQRYEEDLKREIVEAGRIEEEKAEQ